MVSSSGRKLMADEAVDAAKRELLPQCTLVTPNMDEASVLTNQKIISTEDMKHAAKMLLPSGCHAVLVKGGHLLGQQMTDVLLNGETNEFRLFTSSRIESPNTHGTGCTLSSAIAARLVLGDNMEQAVRHTKQYVSQCIATGKDISIGKGHGAMNHFFSPVPLHLLDEP